MTDLATLRAQRHAIRRAALVAGVDFPTPQLDHDIAKEEDMTKNLAAALAYCTELVRLVHDGAPLDRKENGDRVLRTCGGHEIDDLDRMVQVTLFGDEPWARYFKGERNDATATAAFDAVAKAVDPSVVDVPAWWMARVKP